MQSQPRLGPVQVDAGNGVDAIHAIEQGIAMHNQRLGGLGQIAMTVEEGFQSLDQVGVLTQVVFAKQAQGVFTEVAEPFAVAQVQDELVNAQIANEERDIGLQALRQLLGLHGIRDSWSARR